MRTTTAKTEQDLQAAWHDAVSRRRTAEILQDAGREPSPLGDERFDCLIVHILRALNRLPVAESVYLNGRVRAGRWRVRTAATVAREDGRPVELLSLAFWIDVETDRGWQGLTSVPWQDLGLTHDELVTELADAVHDAEKAAL